MIICLEGIDACGKDTQTKLLSSKLVETRQRPTHMFSFPKYDSPTGEIVLSNLKEKWRAGFVPGVGIEEVMPSMRNHPEMEDEAHYLNAMVFQVIQTVNRYEVANHIESTSRISNVVLDRYWPSGWVYGMADGLDSLWLKRIHEYLPQADFYILLDVDPQDSVHRRPERRDRYEKQKGFMEKVSKLYRRLWHEEWNGPSNSRWEVINGRGTIEDTHELIMRCVDGLR